MPKDSIKIDIRELNKMADEIVKAISVTENNVSDAVVKFAYLLDLEAKELISSNHGTGRISARRTVSGNRKKGTGRRTLIHQASAAGEAPVTDTGRLVSSIRPAFYGMFRAEVGSLDQIAKYGGYLETGTSSVSPRPWLEPTLDNNKSQLASYLDAAVKSGGLAS